MEIELNFCRFVLYTVFMMIHDYIMSSLDKARYELIDGGKRYYGEIPALKGVWADGKTLEACRKELASVLEGWIILHIRMNQPVPGLKMSGLKTRAKKEVYA